MNLNVIVFGLILLSAVLILGILAILTVKKSEHLTILFVILILVLVAIAFSVLIPVERKENLNTDFRNSGQIVLPLFEDFKLDPCRDPLSGVYFTLECRKYRQEIDMPLVVRVLAVGLIVILVFVYFGRIRTKSVN